MFGGAFHIIVLSSNQKNLSQRAPFARSAIREARLQAKFGKPEEFTGPFGGGITQQRFSFISGVMLYGHLNEPTDGKK